MSCGHEHEVDCRKVLDAVFLYLDGECEGGQHNLIRTHLDECSPCLREFGLEREVKLLVARKCGGERAPDSLRLSVLARLRSARVDTEAIEFRPE
ncbi:Mycothiol system anti-sigma-R factor [Frankia sp. AiPs1]|uniref:mycothiol system anti-sigma-R factor n=1 Tax=Frankia sp. AiPa1 TaxID=573492 RepID=UPI00202B5656|nr:mycothiol system anti-sigma-R factor [Frankia sp. AiPa1]MCL9758415.1 mycothiol system anti-sigma-R factor [Frankia sp. AiPa1]